MSGTWRAPTIAPRDHRRPRPSVATSSATSSPPTSRAAGTSDGRHALPAGAERLPAHRPRQVDLPELRRRARVRRRAATCASTTPTRSRRSRSTSTPSRPTSAGSASTGATTCIFASDYFEQLYEWAVELIEPAKAYVDDLSADEIRDYRGTLTEPGRDSPCRDRSVDENLDLFARMRARRVPERRARPAREDRHGVARTSTCATPSCTASRTPRTRARATPGASTRRTTSRTASPTRSRA